MVTEYLVHYKKNGFYYFATIYAKDEDEALAEFEKNNKGAYVVEVGALEKEKRVRGREACHKPSNKTHKR